jgi:hypothetical protein
MGCYTACGRFDGGRIEGPDVELVARTSTAIVLCELTSSANQSTLAFVVAVLLSHIASLRHGQRQQGAHQGGRRTRTRTFPMACLSTCYVDPLLRRFKFLFAALVGHEVLGNVLCVGRGRAQDGRAGVREERVPRVLHDHQRAAVNVILLSVVDAFD